MQLTLMQLANPFKVAFRKVRGWFRTLGRPSIDQALEHELSLLAPQRSDIHLKERLDYAYRNLQLLTQVGVQMSAVFIATEIGFFNVFTPFAPRDYLMTQSMFALKGCASLVFFLSSWIMLVGCWQWGKKQRLLFKVAGLLGPPRTFLFLAVLFSVIISFWSSVVFLYIWWNFTLPLPPLPPPPI
jgi:hypothetical protein